MGRRATPVLVRGLNSPVPLVRIRSAWALREMGQDAAPAVPDLIKLRDRTAALYAREGRDEDRLVLLASVLALQRL